MEELRKIRAALAGGITKTDLASRAGVARRILDSIDGEDWNPTFATLTKLARAADELTEERLAALRGVA